MSATQQVKRNRFKRWIVFYFLFIVILLTLNIRTGLYILELILLILLISLIPLILNDFEKDLEEDVKWEQRNK